MTISLPKRTIAIAWQPTESTASPSLLGSCPYTPVETSSLQVSSAEDLLHEIDTSRAYPLDYVIFRITGYHPRIVAPDLLTGIALQHDLGLLIEQLSDRQNLIAARAGEPVLSIDDVTEQFNVTSKTVQRWRRRGLPARRFVFVDGKRRVGFLLSSVERFIRSNGKAVVDASPECVAGRSGRATPDGRICPPAGG